ncbi:MAG: nuclear transport factor 2 family protein [Alphaproteobacteria bacterium]
MTTAITRRRLVTRASAITGGAVLGMAAGTSGHGFAQSETEMAGLSFDRLFSTSTTATALIGEAADRVAIRKLIDAWGHFADRRMADDQAALLIEAGTIALYDGEPEGREPLVLRTGRAELREGLEGLNKYSHTTHFNGQSALAVSGSRAIGETYCMAHHLFEEEGQRMRQVMAIRYYDDFVREGDRWWFAARRLIIDWSETQPSVA